MAFIPQTNYTDWATVTGRRILVPNFVDRGVSRFQRGGTSTAVNLSFLDWSSYFSFQVPPHLSSWGCEENLVGPEIEPRTSGSAARNSEH
jgi:hypothetical protein